MQVRPFHLILFWPLRIKVPPENDTGKAADFWAFIEERMRLDGQDWEAATRIGHTLQAQDRKSVGRVMAIFPALTTPHSLAKWQPQACSKAGSRM